MATKNPKKYEIYWARDGGGFVEFKSGKNGMVGYLTSRAKTKVALKKRKIKIKDKNSKYLFFLEFIFFIMFLNIFY
jgi:hypothetical protein